NGAAGSADKLYFAAGINSEAHGLFGSFTAIPANGGTASVTPPGFVYDPANLALSIEGTNFTFSQTTTANASGLHTIYNFLMDGNFDTFTAAQVSRVIVSGQGSNGSNDTATLITNDTYTGTDQKLHETQEIVILGGGNGRGQ